MLGGKMNAEQKKMTEESTIYQIQKICEGYKGDNYQRTIQAILIRINTSNQAINS